jgi:hypothetical protein
MQQGRRLPPSPQDLPHRRRLCSTPVAVARGRHGGVGFHLRVPHGSRSGGFEGPHARGCCYQGEGRVSGPCFGGCFTAWMPLRSGTSWCHTDGSAHGPEGGRSCYSRFCRCVSWVDVVSGGCSHGIYPGAAGVEGFPNLPLMRAATFTMRRRLGDRRWTAPLLVATVLVAAMVVVFLLAFLQS